MKERIFYAILFIAVLFCGYADNQRLIQQINETEARLVDVEAELSCYKDFVFEVWGDSFDASSIQAVEVEVTSYNPVAWQCDDTPLIASDNGLVTPGVLAMPQHFRKRLGIQLGQKVALAGYGTFTVRDHMNSRFDNRVDIISFIPKWSKKFGKRTAKLIWVADAEI